MNLKFWQRRKTEIRVIARDPIRLRLSEFRTNRALVGEAQKILMLGSLKLMLDVLRNEHPCMMVLQTGSSPNDRVVLQARGEGYTMALANLEAMAQFQEATPVLEATFESEEPQ